MVSISPRNQSSKKRKTTVQSLCVICTLIAMVVFVTSLVSFLSSVIFPSSSPSDAANAQNDSIESDSDQKKHSRMDHVTNKLRHWRDGHKHPFSTTTHRTYGLPARLQNLWLKHQIVGEFLKHISQGTETVEEIIHGKLINRNLDTENLDAAHARKVSIQDMKKSSSSHSSNQLVVLPKNEQKGPMTVGEITAYFTNFLHELHDICGSMKHATHVQIWQAYHDLAVKTLYPWDREYLSRMPQRRSDESIFLSVATYRDENCPNTLKWAFQKAKHPERIFVGLVQQNCYEKCRSGVLEGGRMEDVPPDLDCYKEFCSFFPQYCSQVRLLPVNETESLGPYAARYFASKLWYGEPWYMQIDAHMTFAQDWDEDSIVMLKNAPTKKPVISHYPPGHTTDLDRQKNVPGTRLCGGVFANSDLESQIIRLEGSLGADSVKLKTPRFSGFTAAGYFVAHSEFLQEVPFDPFLPWIFMGEEVIMSARLWTSGYDIFGPTHDVVGHMYVRRHTPKFWENVHRVFTYGIHNPLQMMILNRIKYQLDYPEAAKDMLTPKSLLTAVEQYTMGTARPLHDFLKIVGLNMTEKVVTITNWCETGKPPPLPEFDSIRSLYV